MDAFSPHIDDDLPDSLAARVRDELSPGERIIWAGRSYHRVPRFDLWLGGGVASLVLGGWLFSRIDFQVQANNAAFSFLNVALFVGVIVSWAVGFITLIGGLVKTTGARIASRENARTVFALTDRRAIAWRPAAIDGVEVRSYWPHQVEGTSRVDRLDGLGDVTFVLSDGAAGAPLGTSNLFVMPATVGHGFYCIRQPRLVEGLIHQALIDHNDHAKH